MRAILSLLCLFPVCGWAAASFASASSQYGELTGFTGLTSYPITMAAWFSRTANAAQAIMAVSSGTTERFQLDFDTSSNLVCRSVNAGGSGGTAFTGNGSVKPGFWYHACGTVSANNARAIYWNGSPIATGSTAITVGNIDRVILGARRNGGTLGNYMNGELAQVAVWNVILSDDEIASLGRTNNPVSPLKVRPHHLVFYTPLVTVGSAATYNAMGPAVTWGTAPTSVENPKLMLP